MATTTDQIATKADLITPRASLRDEADDPGSNR